MSNVQNESGIYPTGYRVLVRPDSIEKVTKGGIIIPDTEAERHQQAQSTGVLIACGHDAWSEYRQPWAEPGDRVVFAKYQGAWLHGRDGKKYVLLNDTHLSALLDSDMTFSEFDRREAVGNE